MLNDMSETVKVHALVKKYGSWVTRSTQNRVCGELGITLEELRKHRDIAFSDEYLLKHHVSSLSVAFRCSHLTGSLA